MNLADALLVIAHRDRMRDLNAALALVGVALDDEHAEIRPVIVPVAPPADYLSMEIEPDPPDVSADGWSSDALRSVGALSDNASSPDGPDEAGAGPRPGMSARAAASKPLGVIAGVLETKPGSADDQLGVLPAPYRTVPRDRPVAAAERPPTDHAFVVRTLASTLHSMVRVWQQGAEPDIDAVVASIAKLELLTKVPTVRRLGQPDRICVLCDLRLRSGPYRDDVRYLLRLVRRLFGDARLEIMTFLGSPARGCGTGPVWTWEPYATYPKFEATVVVGIGTATRDGDPEDVYSFAMQVLAAGGAVCTVLIGAAPATPAVRPYPQLLVQD